MTELIFRVLLAGALVAIAAAPLGCLVVWRRMAYFGDATSHAGLLGVTVGLALGIDIMFGVAILAGVMALVVTVSMRRGRYAVDTILGVFAHAALAIGLVSASLMPGVRINLVDTLQGDILSVQWADILIMGIGTAILGGAILLRWRSLLSATLHPDLMVAEGGSITMDRLTFTLSMALFVALAMKLVGVLLITAMLILPAAAARPLSRSPEQMVALTMLMGLLSVGGGVWFSWITDAPTGPSIVAVSAVGFALSNLGAWIRA